MTVMTPTPEAAFCEVNTTAWYDPGGLTGAIHRYRLVYRALGNFA
jgi:hypothetical protein